MSKSSTCLKFLKLIFIGVGLLYRVVLVSALQRSESALRIPYTYIHSFGVSFPFRSAQSIEESPLSSTAGSHSSSIFYIVMCLSGATISKHRHFRSPRCRSLRLSRQRYDFGGSYARGNSFSRRRLPPGGKQSSRRVAGPPGPRPRRPVVDLVLRTLLFQI